MSKVQKRNVEKERFWRKVIDEASGSGMSVREFCRARSLKESQFYWWHRELKKRHEDRHHRGKSGWAKSSSRRASFALVSGETGAMEANIELVLGEGCRVRIGKGVDEETLRTVLAVVEREGC